MKIILPKRYPTMPPSNYYFFVAGPVLGGGDWQAKFIAAFMARAKQTWTNSFYDRVIDHIRFVVPCRWGEEHPLALNFETTFDEVTTANGREELICSQTFWENYFLSDIVHCRVPGQVVFGLFKESKEAPRTDGLPYAGDTRGEIGRWLTEMKYSDREDTVRLYAESDFPGLPVMMKNILFHLPKQGKSIVSFVPSPEEMAALVATEFFDKYKQTN